MAMKIENVGQNKEVLAHKLFYGKDSAYVNHLQTLGKVGIIHNMKKVHEKLEN